MTVSIDGSNGVVFNDLTTQNTSAFYGGLAFRNRIINGAMVIDQRNAGAAVTPTTLAYTLDRWSAAEQTDGSMTVQQSSTAATGFTNSLLVTVTSADTSLGATQYAVLRQAVEGFNVADFGWGTANAQTITLSFWVRSSLTGTFGGAIQNSAQDRSYPFSYTISTANTWEYKTVTIPGDTTGTWLTTSGTGLSLWLGLGVGSTYSGTAGAWAGSLAFAPTGAVSLIGTNGATFYITGVQLEKGSTATSFDYRPYGTELTLCQRYYEATTNNSTMLFSGDVTTSQDYYVYGNWVVPKRASPTFTSTISSQSGFSSSTTSPTVSISSWSVASNATATGARKYYFFGYTASSEL